MYRSSSRFFALAATALVLSAGTVEAQGKSKDQGKDKDKDKGRTTQMQRRDDDRRTDRDRVYRGDDGVYRRADGTYRHEDGTWRKVPPGLAKKPGGMPPGQYKKRYGTSEGASVLRDVFGRRGYTVIRTTPYGESQYVYYRLRDGSERRAIVSPGTDRLAFSNVPASLLTEVLSRLY